MDKTISGMMGESSNDKNEYGSDDPSSEDADDDDEKQYACSLRRRGRLFWWVSTPPSLSPKLEMTLLLHRPSIQVSNQVLNPLYLLPW